MEKALDQIFELGDVTIARFVVNTIRENTYIIYNKACEGILVDCGVRRPSEEEKVAAFVDSHSITLKHHLLTHAHFDHVWGAQWANDSYGVVPVMLRQEYPNYLQAESIMQQVLHRPLLLPLPANPLLVDEGAVFAIDGIRLSYVHTPGHTHGGACLYDADKGLLFSGDSLFKSYIGLPKEEGLAHEMMQQTLCEKIYVLPASTFVLPGHGPEFVLGERRR